MFQIKISFGKDKEIEKHNDIVPDDRFSKYVEVSRNMNEKLFYEKEEWKRKYMELNTKYVKDISELREKLNIVDLS